MLKLNELKPGAIVEVIDQDIRRTGTVVSISNEQHQALINNGIQEFWYSPEDIYPIALSQEQLIKLGFAPEDFNGGIKYKKDSFRLVIPKSGDFSNINMWWREDKRHFNFPIGVHILQNLYLDMTKVHLEAN